METPEEFLAAIEAALKVADLERATQLVDQAHAILSKEAYARLVSLLAQLDARLAPQAQADAVPPDAAQLLTEPMGSYPADALTRPLATGASSEHRSGLNHTPG